MNKLINIRRIILFLCFIAFDESSANESHNEEIVKSLKITEVKNKILNYLNSFHTLQANFEQWSAKGKYYAGVMYIKKPHSLFMRYKNEQNLRILTDQQSLYLINYSNANVKTIPIDKTPASLLLNSDTLNLNFIVDTFKENEHIIDVTFKNRDKKNNFGLFRLVLSKNPLQIIKWIIIDVYGNKTIVKLSNIQTDIQLNDDLFTLSNAKKIN